MNIEIKKDEKVEDLQFNNLKIIQNKKGFCFGIDSILLVDFSKGIKNNSNVLDLGTGTGIIPILLSGKTNAKSFTGIEVQEEVADMALRSVKLNKLENKITIVNRDILDLEYDNNTFDVIVTNPPYKEKGTGLKNEDKRKIISRHETTAKLEDFIMITKKLLKDKGEFYMVNRPERLVDILNCMRKYKIEPKNIRFVYANHNSEPKLVLIKGIKNARPFLKIDKNLYIYDKDGNYTDEIKGIYNM